MGILEDIWDFIYHDEHGPTIGMFGVPVIGLHFSAFSVQITLILVFIVFISLSEVVFHKLNITAIPESAVVIVTGCLIGVLTSALKYTGVLDSDSLEFEPQILFLVLIPPIIFEAGWAMDKFFFFKNIKMILLYAVFGTLCNAIFTGLSLFLFSLFLFNTKLSIFTALSYGSLISAVDPVAVLAIFEEIHVDSTLNIIIFGESVLNDAVSIVLFQLFNSMSQYEIHGDIEFYLSFVAIPLLAIVRFCIVSLGGMVVGVFAALSCIFITKYTSHVPLLEISLLYSFGLFSYILAEQLSFSGIIAELVCAIIMSRYITKNISRSSFRVITQAQKLLSLLAENFTFFLLGHTLTGHFVDEFPDSFDFFMILVTLVSVVFFRFVIIFTMTLIANRTRTFKLSFKDQFIIAYGGLRGAIAFALAFLIDESLDSRLSLITTTLFVILFTIFVQGTTMKPLIHLLRIKTGKSADDDGIAGLSLSRPIDSLTEMVEVVLGKSERFTKIFRYIDKIIQRIFLRKLLDAEEEIVMALHRMQEAGKTGVFDYHDQMMLKQAEESLHDPNINLERVAEEAAKFHTDNRFVQKWVRMSQDLRKMSIDVNKMRDRYGEAKGSLELDRNPDLSRLRSMEFSKSSFDRRFKSVDMPKRPSLTRASTTMNLIHRPSLDLEKLKKKSSFIPEEPKRQSVVHFSKSTYNLGLDMNKQKHNFQRSALGNSFSNFRKSLDISFPSDIIDQTHAEGEDDDHQSEDAEYLDGSNDGFSST